MLRSLQGFHRRNRLSRLSDATLTNLSDAAIELLVSAKNDF